MTGPMYVVLLQVFIDHDDFPPEQVPDRYRVSRVVGGSCALAARSELRRSSAILARDLEPRLGRVLAVHYAQRPPS